MAGDKLFGEIVQELIDTKKEGALYISMVETSEDLVRMYFKDGQIYHLRYGTAVGNDCLEILEYYNLHSATFFEGIKAPDKPATDLPPTRDIVGKIRKLDKKIKLR